MAAVLLVVAAVALSACSDGIPPEDTVSALGDAVGDAKLDDVDFPALVESFTSDAYRANTEPDQANYQLYLAAKAALLGLGTESENIEVTRDVSGKKATISFAFAVPEGLFAVADLRTVDVALVRVDSPTYPWRIDGITLGR